jgi:hypothetical protein
MSGEHVGFVVDKVALGRVFSVLRFPLPINIPPMSIIIITWGWHNCPISGRSAEWTQLDSTPNIPIKNKCIVMNKNFEVF